MTSPRIGIDAELFVSIAGRLPRAYACDECTWCCVAQDDGEEALALKAYVQHLVEGCGEQ